jgi:hypothetical protein
MIGRNIFRQTMWEANDLDCGGIIMEWYERLNEYFPEHEMKDPRQMHALIEDKEVYHKEETDDYIMLYAEFPAFIFIDWNRRIGKMKIPSGGRIFI